ncbi:MAG: helix-turn-helix domain-containing protein [Sandaracinaceae bacterium]
MSLSDKEIEALAIDEENYRVERKRSLASKTKIEEAICAFANDLPGSGEAGVLMVGVEDDGTPAGIAIDDALLQSLASIRSDGNILPFPQLTVEKRRLKGVDIAVVEVWPSHNTPLRLRGRVCVRVGPRRDTATRDEERILVERRRSWDGPFDQAPVHGATLDDLNLDVFQKELLPNAVDAETLAKNSRSTPEQLTSLHLASPDAVPNVAGLLLLGHDPTAFVKGAYVQFLRINGSELTDPIADRRELSGPLPTVLREMDALTRSHIRVATKFAGTDKETNQPDYPLSALQQLLRNAAMHRNYETSNAPIQWYWFDDRVEIHNPGGLFGRATPETFGQPGGNDYRNPTLAAGLHALGYVQRFGFGVPLARKACRDNGNPEPEFKFQPGTFATIVRKA